VDWLQFIASIVGSLAWPSVVIAALLIFKRQLLALAPQLRELEYGSFKLKFQQELGEMAAKAEELNLPEPPAPPEQDAQSRVQLPRDSDETLALQAALSPRSVVIESWTAVEHEIRNALRRAGIGVTLRGPTQQLKALARKTDVSPYLIAIIEDLQRLRNEAAHYPDFALAPSQAIDYARRANQAAAALRTILPTG
jgi:hypothetical protein